MKTGKSILVVLFALSFAQMASAYYCPSTGHWLSRDPVGEPGFENIRAAENGRITSSAFLSPGRWINRDSVKAKNGPNLYAFAGNNGINRCDVLGLKERDVGVVFNQCDALNDADKSALMSALDVAADRLDAVLDGEIALPNNLTTNMAACIRGKLNSLGITCLSSCDPICWAADGMGFPHSDTILLCAAKIKKGPGPARTMALLALHEACHICGKVGHSDPDDPYTWGSWLTGPMAPLPDASQP